MKIQILTTIAALALFVTLAAGSASAQSANIMKVTVPFDFVISHKTLPAGDYVVRRRIEGALVVLAIQNEDKNESAYLVSHNVQARDLQSGSKLVFNQYGDQYFLSQLWFPGNYGQELTKTRRERLLGREMAKGRSKPKTIDVAIRSK